MVHGVVVPVELAARLSPLLGDVVRRERARGHVDAELDRLAAELDEVRRAALAGRLPIAAGVSTGARSSAHTVTVTEYVRATGIPRRTVTERCRTDVLDAVLIGKWWINECELVGVRNGYS